MNVFDTIYKEYFSALVFYSFRIVHDMAVAEDMVEGAILKYVERYYDPGNPRTPQEVRVWLYTTVRNDSINEIKKQHRHRGYQSKYASLCIDSCPDISHDIIRAEVTRIMYKAIDRLPTECGKIFKLMYVQGLSVRQTAEVLNLSISTIKNQKAIGLGKLKKVFRRMKVEDYSKAS